MGKIIYKIMLKPEKIDSFLIIYKCQKDSNQYYGN